MLRLRGILVAALILTAWDGGVAIAQLRLRTESDRSALRAWFVRLADAQFYRATPDVTDCAGLVRHALREALRPHTPDWVRRARLPTADLAPEVVERPVAADGALPLFLVATAPPRHAEFADARTIVTLNATPLGRDVRAARPGDLLYFRHERQDSPDHLMVFVGPTATDRSRQDWIVYHTGPNAGAAGAVRKVALPDLLRHPSAGWRPLPANHAFVGVFRLNAFL